MGAVKLLQDYGDHRHNLIDRSLGIKEDEQVAGQRVGVYRGDPLLVGKLDFEPVLSAIAIIEAEDLKPSPPWDGRMNRIDPDNGRVFCA